MVILIIFSALKLLSAFMKMIKNLSYAVLSIPSILLISRIFYLSLHIELSAL